MNDIAMGWSAPTDGSLPHVMYAHGQAFQRPGTALSAVAAATSPDLVVSTGMVLTSDIVTYAIYWGSLWGTNPFTGDKETGIASLLGGLGGSNYLNITSEYYRYGSPTLYITPSSPYAGSLTDNSNPPAGDLLTSPQTVGTEVCNVLSAHHISPNPNAIYVVYSTSAADANACGWHWYGSCGSTNVQFAYVLDNDNFTCAPNLPIVAGHSVGLSRIADVTAHEVAEAVTDPRNGGWKDSYGKEIADLCQDQYTGPGQSTTLSNGAVFAIQDLWSNNAHDQNYGTGDSWNLGATHGCVPAAPWSHVVTWFTSGNNPSEATVQEYCTWTASAAGGTPPYTYNWTAAGSNLLPMPNGSSFTVYKYDSNQWYLQLIVKDATGQQATITRTVPMVSFGTTYCSNIP